MRNYKFKIGDVVRIKSDPTAMTIIYRCAPPNLDPSYNLYSCIYFDLNNCLHRVDGLHEDAIIFT